MRKLRQGSRKPIPPRAGSLSPLPPVERIGHTDFVLRSDAEQWKARLFGLPEPPPPPPNAPICFVSLRTLAKEIGRSKGRLAEKFRQARKDAAMSEAQADSPVERRALEFVD